MKQLHKGATTGSIIALMLGALLLNLALGDFKVALIDVIKAFMGSAGQLERFILFELRLPRALTAVFIGACFGISGALFQSLARNPLASPDIIGFNAGAALGAVITLAMFGLASSLAITLGALLGGGLAAGLVFGLAWRGGLQPETIVLVGIGIGFSAFAAVEFLLSRGNLAEASNIMQWLTGSLNAVGWDDVWISGIGLFIFALPLFLIYPWLLTLELGDALATSLGLNPLALRAIAAIWGVCLLGLAIAVAGPIAFVAFISGPIARRIFGTTGPNLLGAAAIGALVVLLADLAARLLFAPLQLPTGIFTALFGAPYLIWLLSRQIQRGEI